MDNYGSRASAWRGAALALSMALFLFGAVAAGAESRVSVGMVEADGVLVPVAAFRKGKWVGIAPEKVCYKSEKERVDKLDKVIGVLFQGAPVMREWGVYPYVKKGPLVLSRRSKRITIKRPVYAAWRCLRGFHTDYPDAIDTDAWVEEGFFDPLGIAVEGKGFEFETMIKLKPGSEEARGLIEFVRSKAEGLEEQALLRALEQYGHDEYVINGRLFGTFPPFSEEERASVKLRVKSVYRTRSAIGGKLYYYFEALKHYPPTRENPSCDGYTFFKGLVSRSRVAGIRFIHKKVVPANCETQGDVGTMVPFGAVVINGRPSFVVMSLSETGRKYEVLRVVGRRLKAVGNDGGDKGQ